MSSLALGFCACDDDEVIDGVPQTNGQLPQMAADGVVPSTVINPGQAINLETAKDAMTINVIDIAEVTNLPADNELKLEMLFADNVGLDNARSVEVTLKDDAGGNMFKKGYVYAEDWDNAFNSVFGKSPETRDGYIGFDAYAVKGTSSVYLGRVGSATAVSVTPYESIFVDDVYHLVINGEVRAALKCTGGNVYDNPTFSGKVKISLENDFDPETFICSWRVVADRYVKTGDAAAGRMVFAPDADSREQATGTLLTNTTSADIPEDGVMPLDGDLVFTVNVESMTFSIAEAPKTYYMIGQFCGWNWDNAAEMIPVNGSPNKYWTIRYVKGDTDNGFKFNSNTAWDGGEWGYGVPTIRTNVAGEIVDAGGNLSITKSGWYIFVVDVSGDSPVLDILEPDVYVFGAAAGGNWGPSETNRFDVIDDPDAEWPFVSPDVLATDGTDDSNLRLCIKLEGHEWWQTEFIFYEDGNIVYRGTGGDQARTGNAAGKVYLNFVTGKGKVE